MNRLLDKYLGSTAFLRQAPDNPSGGAADSGGTSSPQSTPSPAVSVESAPAASTAEPASGSGSESAIDYDVFFGGAEPPEPAPATPPAPPTPTAPDAPKPATTPTPEPPAPVAAAVPPVAPPVAPSPTGDAPSASTTPPLDPTDPASLATHLQENKQAMIEHVAKTLFTITDEEAEGLETNAVATIPKLLARSFVEMQSNMLQQFSRLVPAMVQKTTAAVQRNAESEAKFFAAWPQLNPAAHGDLVRRYAVTFRQMHPQASFEDMVAQVGPMAMMAARVVPSATAPGAAAGSPPTKPQPFVPAGPGSTSVVSSTPAADPYGFLDPAQQQDS